MAPIPTFNLNEFGATFATRGRGKELREELLSRMAGEEMIEVDFAGVTNVSYSFADEFFGVLMSCTGAGVPVARLVNVEPAVDRVVSDAIGRRRGEPVTC
jgi:anti-anti-sigma regulatory factor